MATPQQAKGRPKLSLKISTAQVPSARVVSRRVSMVDPKSPTAFNTLSNAYATAIDRSTPVQTEPLTAIDTRKPLRIDVNAGTKMIETRTRTPYVASYPETPLTAHAISPVPMEMVFPSTMTATPPLSAGPVDHNLPTFTFSAADTGTTTRLSVDTNIAKAQASPRTPRRRTTLPTAASLAKAPYSHPGTLHSILRNSPLPAGMLPPVSPRRQSVRLQEKAAKKVCYNNPLTQTIINNKYTKSHIDLLIEEASPISPYIQGENQAETVLDLAVAFPGNEIQDGGTTPGPFEEMRRRMASLGTSSPLASPSGVRKRKKKEKKRHWAWTISQEDDGNEEVSGAIAATRAAEAAAKVTASEMPTSLVTSPETLPSVAEPAPTGESQCSVSGLVDVEMSDGSSLVSDDYVVTPGGMDLDEMLLDVEGKDALQTPVVVRRNIFGVSGRLHPANVRGDSPVPPEILAV